MTKAMINPLTAGITERILSAPHFYPDAATARQLADIPDTAIVDLLFGAGKIRSKFVGDDIFTCTILNAKSGRCSQDCAFCAQSARHDTRITAYPLLSKQEMIDCAMKSDDAGITNFSMVTSGYRLTDAEIDTICETASAITARTDLTVCCSIGMIDAGQAEKLTQSGITHYHHNLETAESHFHAVCTTHEYAEDIESIRTARQAGLTVCAGGIFGLGETWAQRIEMALTLREIGVSKIPLNFINPIAGTPFSDRPRLTPMEALKTIALYRYLLPDRDIVLCGGRDVTLKDFQSWIFFAGANGIMTGNYLTTRGRSLDADREMISAWKMSLT
ncbi:MAG: biotin synthase BioB [Thermodesulfobacteriota bacterium]